MHPLSEAPIPPVRNGNRFSFSSKVGDWLDARDNDGNWCAAQVVNIEGESLRVHFQGYHSRFDEDLRLESPKVRPPLLRNILYLVTVGSATLVCPKYPPYVV